VTKILNGIDERGLGKHHNVKLRPHPGATTRDIVDHVKLVARKRPNMLLIQLRTSQTTMIPPSILKKSSLLFKR